MTPDACRAGSTSVCSLCATQRSVKVATLAISSTWTQSMERTKGTVLSQRPTCRGTQATNVHKHQIMRNRCVPVWSQAA